MRLLLAALLLPALASAAPQKSCPPLGVIPGYVPDEARTRAWEPMEFTRKTGTGDETEDAIQTGRTCVISYRIKDGAEPMSNLEVQTNYRQQLQSLGAVLQSESGRDTYAVLVTEGVEKWFRIDGGEDIYELTVMQVEPPRLTLLPPSGADYRLLGHLPGFVANKPVTRSYDTMNFSVIDNGEEKDVAAQGRTFTVHYDDKRSGDPMTNAEISWNYREALKTLGAEILFTGTRDTTARLLQDGQAIWLRIYAGETSVDISVVEEKPFEPTIRPPPPTQMQAALAQTGRIALYVNFDFDRSTLRPEAAPVVAEVAALLKADPALRLSIEGHTDSLGTADRNRTLSADRAASFAAAVAAQGVPPARLASAGFGPDKPIATNDTTEGRAKNRRVELVRIPGG